MPIVVELPGGHSCHLRSSEELSNKQVKILRRAARKVGLVGEHLKELGLDELQTTDTTDETVDPESPEAKEATETRNRKALKVLTELSDSEDDDLDLFQRTCAAIRIIDWTLDLPIPSTPEDVDNLPRPIYEALTTEAAKLDLNESFDVDGADDPKAGTEGSESSEQPSPEEPSPNP